MQQKAYPVVVESLNDGISSRNIGEAHLSHDCRIGSNQPAVQDVSTDIAHNTLDVRGGGPWREVAGNHDIRPASSASYADAAAICGRLLRSECVASGLRR